MSPLTLADYKVSPKPMTAAVAKMLSEENTFMDALPFENVAALAVEVTREPDNLPTVAWRNMGAAHGENNAQPPKVAQETVYSIGETITVDKMLVKDTSPRLVNPATWQTRMKIRAIGRTFCDAVINGVPTDQYRPIGLWHRLKDTTNYAEFTSQTLNGGGLDISPDATGLAANIQTFFDYLDALLYAMTGSVEVGGMGVHLLCNSTILKRYQSAARQSGLLTTSKDALGRVFVEYKGARFIDMGLKVDDSTMLIGNVELDNGSALTGGDATSIYGVRFGNEYFTGIQEYALEVSELELTDNKVTYKSVIDWAVGIAVSSKFGIARLTGIVAK